MLIRLTRDHVIWTGRILRSGSLVDMPDEDAYAAFAAADPPGLPLARVRWAPAGGGDVEGVEAADVRGDSDHRFLYRTRVVGLREHEVGGSRLSDRPLIGVIRPKDVVEVRSDVAVELVAAGVCRFADPASERLGGAVAPYRVPPWPKP